MDEQSIELPRPSTHKMSDAEAKILSATERVLAEVGARDLSVAQILAEANVARGTFYHYFTSKWDVIIRLARDVMDEIDSRVQYFLHPGADEARAEMLRSSILEGCEIWAEHRSVIRAIVEHWRTVPEIGATWLSTFERFTDEIASTIRIERAAGRAIEGPPERQLASTLLWSTGYVLYLAGLQAIPDLPAEQNVESSLIALWMGTLYGVAV